MLTISKPPVGAIAYGRSGLGYIIEALEADRILLTTPSGLKRVPLDAVIRWELPAPINPAPGQRVRLKGTHAEYMVIEIYDHFMGWKDGDRTTETWARLKTADSKPATWKLSQLEAIA
jgi:D-serine deaminase-like pyridoxal phosphate-dependent protein